MSIIKTTLRKWRLEDADAVAKYANNPAIAANLRDGFPYPYARDNAVSFIEMAMNTDRSKSLLYCIDYEGEAVGSIGVFRKDDVYRYSCEMGYWLAEPFWGHGIMSESTKQLLDIVFTEWVDVIRVYAEPYAFNAASTHVLHKCGFTLEGRLRQSVIKNGVVHDSFIYSLLRSEWKPT